MTRHHGEADARLAPGAMPVLLPLPARVEPPPIGLRHVAIVGVVMIVWSVDVWSADAWAVDGLVPPSAWSVLVKWAPLLLQGFAFNVSISLMAMALGTVAGFALGLLLVSEARAVRGCAWSVMQFFRNAPWLVLLFFAMFLIPYRIQLFGHAVPLPDWSKAVVGFALPVMANTAEIMRGAVASIPATQWEAAESLALSRRRTLWLVILPQCVKRMLPPWMNLYALITMSTVEASIVGVSEMLTITSQVHAAEGGLPDLFAPLYAFALLCFFLYCYPIGVMTGRLERRFDVR